MLNQCLQPLVDSSIIDMRATDAGTYYLRVYDPKGAVTADKPFTIEIDAPKQGYVHPKTDRDVIHGGDGETTPFATASGSRDVA